MRSTTERSARNRSGATAVAGDASPRCVPAVIIGVSTALGNNLLQRSAPAAAARGRAA
ncbi:MAG TPA: hypothetical protein VE397_13620 [Stellaceae bacterium]|nr:hypothetical protein [Stellaceae bacterium]